MALVYKVAKDEVNTDLYQFAFDDTTGLYSGNNTGGWGAPNFEKTDVLTSKVEIYYPKSDTVDKTILNLELADYEFPNTNADITLSNQDILGDNTLKFDDGVWLFDFEIVMNDELSTTYSAPVYVLNTKNVECCISKYAATKLDYSCSDSLCKLAKLEAMLFAVQCAFDGEEYERAETLLDELTDMCNNEDCGC